MGDKGRGNGSATTVDPVNEVFAPSKMFALGLQHVLVMYAGAIAVPFIIGTALNLRSQDIAFLISADLLTCGIATLIQAVGFWKFGVRLPLMQGVSFISVTPIIAIGTSPELLSAGPDAAMQVIYGSILVAGVFAILVAPFARFVIQLFPPLVVGTMLMIIGTSLMPVAINYVAGSSAGESAVPTTLLLALGVLVVIILINRLGRGLLSNLSMLIGLVFGLIVAAMFGMADFSGVKDAAWFAIITPFHFGAPKFELAPSITMCLVVMVTWVESAGDAIFIGKLVGKPAKGKDISNLIRADGLATIVGGALNSFPYTAFSENVALVSITGVKSRWVIATAGVIIACLGLFPKLGATFAALPAPVIGAAGFMMFGVLFSAGAKMLQEVDFDKGLGNFTVLGLSVIVSLIPTVHPGFFEFMPEWTHVLFNSNVMLGALMAIGLNLIINGLYRPDADFYIEEKPELA